MRAAHTLMALLLGVTACDNAGKSLTLPPLPGGGIAVGVYFDRDGSQTQTNADTVVEGVRVALLAAGGTDTLRTAVTGATGTALFENVPLGSYRIVVDRAALHDSIGVVVGDTGTIQLQAGDGNNVGGRIVRLGYLEATIGEARDLPAGTRVFVRGVVHTPLQSFRDSSSFITSSSGSIRITGARHRPGRSGNNPGDSIQVLATTGTRDGQPVLLEGLIRSLAEVTAPVSQLITVADIALAGDGTLDAAFVSIIGAKIVDTLTSGADFVVTVADPVDAAVTAQVIIDAQLNAPRTSFKPGLPISVRGVLVPRVPGTWVLKPRGGGDITIG